MLHKLSVRWAKKLAECSGNNREEIYIYGIEIIISTAVGFMSILLLSGLLSCWTSGFIFISAFVPLRLFTGGYHASSYTRCFILSNISYLLVLLVCNITWKDIPIAAWIGVFISMSCYIIRYAPVINSAQPINEKKQKRSKIISRYILLADMLWIIYLALNHKELMVMAVLSICLVTILMMIPQLCIVLHKLR